jgi:hypothetical protein
MDEELLRLRAKFDAGRVFGSGECLWLLDQIDHLRKRENLLKGFAMQWRELATEMRADNERGWTWETLDQCADDIERAIP